jgi:hypothetical protein
MSTLPLILVAIVLFVAAALLPAYAGFLVFFGLGACFFACVFAVINMPDGKNKKK